MLRKLRSEMLTGEPSRETADQLFAALLHQCDLYPATVYATPHVVRAAAEARPEHRRWALG